MLACLLFCKFCEPNKTVKLKGANVNYTATIATKIFPISDSDSNASVTVYIQAWFPYLKRDTECLEQDPASS